MEEVATGAMWGNHFTELAIRASSSPVTIPVCSTVSIDRIWIRTTAGFCRSGFRISGHARHSCSSSRVVLRCKGDGHNHDASSDDMESSNSWGRSEEEAGDSKAANAAEANRLRRENSELRASLTELSQSLASISAALADVSRAVQLVARAVDCGPSENGLLGVPATPPTLEPADVPLEISATQVCNFSATHFLGACADGLA